MGDQGENRDEKLTLKGQENKAKLLDYLGNPENDWPKRSDYSRLILDYKKPHQIYVTLSPQILTEIESDAIEIRKARSARQRSIILDSLFQRAKGYSHVDTKFFKTSDDDIIHEEYIKHYPPDPVAGREFLDRVEGKVKEVKEIQGNITIELVDFCNEKEET